MADTRRKSLLEQITTLEPAPPWEFLGVTNTISVAFIGTVLLGTLVAGAWLEDIGAPFTVISLAGRALGALLVIGFIFSARHTPQDRAALRLQSSPLPLAFMGLIGLGAAITIDVLGLLIISANAFLNSVPELYAFFEQPPTTTQWLIAGVFLVVLRPLAEGLVFWGVSFPWLRVKLGAWWGLLLTALLYAAFHLFTFAFLAAAPPSFDLATTWYAFFAPLLTGVFLGVLRAASGSTRAVIAAYSVFGVFALVKLLAAGA